MIYRETNEVEGMFYDSKVTLSDWRYSAVVVGLIRYFDYHNISYHINKREGVEGVQLRKTANNIFTRVNKMLADKDVELFNIMIPTNKGPQNIKLVIFEHIAHGWLLDGIIEGLLQASLKSTVRLEFITYILININQIMYEEMGMYSINHKAF